MTRTVETRLRRLARRRRRPIGYIIADWMGIVLDGQEVDAVVAEQADKVRQ